MARLEGLRGSSSSISSSSSTTTCTTTSTLVRLQSFLLCLIINVLLLFGNNSSRSNAFTSTSLSSSTSISATTKSRNTTTRRSRTTQSLLFSKKENDAAAEEDYTKNNGDNNNSSINKNDNDVVGDFFRNVGKFFGNPNVMKKLGGEGHQSVVGTTRSATKDFSQHGGVAGTLLLSLEATQIKVGALRLLLTLWFMGQQNFPQENTWKCNQSAEGDLDMYYVPDQSGALTIELTEEYGLRIYSLGGTTQQSNSFLLQQNALLDNLLNELEHTVLNPSSDADKPIKDSDKLLILKHPNAIQEARENLISFA